MILGVTMSCINIGVCIISIGIMVRIIIRIVIITSSGSGGTIVGIIISMSLVFVLLSLLSFPLDCYLLIPNSPKSIILSQSEVFALTG